MNLYDDVFLFTQVVDYGSFLSSAKHLKIEQSTISRRIKRLEESLGLVLIRRNTKNFDLTEAGLNLYESFKDSKRELDQKMSCIVERKNTLKGTLNVLLPPTMANEIITPRLPEFLRRYPDINLNIIYSYEELNLIKDHYDIAITALLPKQQTQKVKFLFSAERVFYCTKKYVEKYGLPKTPRELENHLVTGFLLDDHSMPGTVEFENRNSGEKIIIPMPRRLLINGGSQSMVLAKTDEVISRNVDYMHMNKEESQRLVRVLEDYKISQISYYLIRHNNDDDAKVAIFYDFVQECVKDFFAQAHE